MTQPILFDTKRTAQFLGVTERQVQRLVKTGKLPVYETWARQRLFRKSDVYRASSPERRF